MKRVLIAVAVLIAGVVGTGFLLPRRHTVTRSTSVAAAPAAVYAVVRDFGSSPSWRSGVERVEVVSPSQFREHANHDVVTYDIIEDIPARRITTRIADKDLGYSGAWTYEFEPDGRGTRVTITEHGDVSNPLFRFLSRFVFGHSATIDEYLRDLSRRFNASR
ncbi:MAG TPA: SRPBCC family protein [Thermoanaerobaculia bacterium]|nr:SRPBCC family protein [Thermoanaerobaculia bacterium]